MMKIDTKMKIRTHNRTLILTGIIIFLTLSITSVYIINSIILGGRNTVSEELDYCHFLQNTLNDICGERKIEVIPKVGRKYVQSRMIVFQILDYSNDLKYYVQIINDVCNHYSLKYFSYIIFDNRSEQQIIIQEQKYKYYFKSEHYVIYLRLVLYVLKFGHYPRNIDELSNFSFYAKRKAKRIDVSTCLLIRIKNSINIHQMQEECTLSIIDTYSNRFTIADYTVILSDGELLSWNYYRQKISGANCSGTNNHPEGK